MNIIQFFKSRWCWACAAKAGFAAGVVAVLIGRNNPYVSILAIFFSLLALVFHKRERDPQKHGQLIFFGFMGLTLGVIMFIIGIF